jgi:hypothetical protein
MSLIRPVTVGIVLAALAGSTPADAGPNAGSHGFFLRKQPAPTVVRNFTITRKLDLGLLDNRSGFSATGPAPTGSPAAGPGAAAARPTR